MSCKFAAALQQQRVVLQATRQSLKISLLRRIIPGQKPLIPDLAIFPFETWRLFERSREEAGRDPTFVRICKYAANIESPHKYGNSAGRGLLIPTLREGNLFPQIPSGSLDAQVRESRHIGRVFDVFQLARCINCKNDPTPNRSLPFSSFSTCPQKVPQLTIWISFEIVTISHWTGKNYIHN